MAVVLKLKRRAAAAQRQRMADRVQAQFGKSVEPLFPAESDPDLACLVTVGLPDSHAQRVVDALSDLSIVEYAEGAPRRKIVGA